MQILVHGEQHNMMRLKSKLLSLNADKSDKDKVKVFSPKNCEELKIPFKTEKIAKVVGKLAQLSIPQDRPGSEDGSRLITGVLVQNDFKMSLMAPEDLREYAGLTTTTIACRQKLTLSAAGIELIRWALEESFGKVEEIIDGNVNGVELNGKPTTNGSSSNGGTKLDGKEVITTYLVMDCIYVRHQGRGAVEVEWEGNMLNDGIADSVLSLLLELEHTPAAVKREWCFNSVSEQTTLTQAHRFVLAAFTLARRARIQFETEFVQNRNTGPRVPTVGSSVRQRHGAHRSAKARSGLKSHTGKQRNQTG